MKKHKIILKGEHDAIILRCDTANKYEIVVAYGYDEESQSWGQGHYFTLWYNEITEENKKALLKRAMDFWLEREYY